MEHLITAKAKSDIIKLATHLSNTFSINNQTDLIGICQDEGLPFYIDNYGDHFDGMLVWDGNFHIHLNSNKGNNPETNRGRFSLAHELAHYFIDSHREGIKHGLIPPHPSNLSLVHSDIMEAEADYFASCLLIPSEKLKRFTGRRKFSLDIIKQVSKEFNVSLTAAAIRFAEVGTHGIMVVFASNNIARWYCKSPDFPNLAHRFKVGSTLPPTSVIGESFLKSDSKYTGIEDVDLEDWFFAKSGAPTWKYMSSAFTLIFINMQ